MTKFNSKTMSKLNRFANNVAKQISFGIKNGLIGSSNKSVDAELKEFMRKYVNELSRDHQIKVSNILKTPKQLKFVCGSIAYRLRKANVA